MKNQNTIFTAILFTFALLCAAVAPKALGVVPAPDGGYPGFNTAEGQNALLNLTTGTANTGVGWFSLSSATAGSFNTATGAGALLFNTADQNTAFGAAALLFNSTGFGNTAAGSAALLNNTEGAGNTAIGISALFSNVTGNDNTATGAAALGSNTTGFNNTATGRFALTLNAEGAHNTAVGHSALIINSSGTFNTAIGAGALFNNAAGNSNTALGFGAGADLTGDNNIDIGVEVRGLAGESNTIRIGDNLPQDEQSNCYIGGIFDGAIDADSFFVAVDVNNKLGDHLALGPKVRVKDVVESLTKVEELEATVAALTTQLKEQAAKIQKVSAQVEMNKPATRVVLNNP
jgi:hypothetical protein